MGDNDFMQPFVREKLTCDIYFLIWLAFHTVLKNISPIPVWLAKLREKTQETQGQLTHVGLSPTDSSVRFEHVIDQQISMTTRTKYCCFHSIDWFIPPSIPSLLSSLPPVKTPVAVSLWLQNFSQTQLEAFGNKTVCLCTVVSFLSSTACDTMTEQLASNTGLPFRPSPGFIKKTEKKWIISDHLNNETRVHVSSCSYGLKPHWVTSLYHQQLIFKFSQSLSEIKKIKYYHTPWIS